MMCFNDSEIKIFKMDYDISKYDYKDIDAIYHSNSMDEMKVKADLYAIDLNDVDVLLALCDTTTYHHAFWPHTKKRFTAFKNLLRYEKSIEEASRSIKFSFEVKRALDAYLHEQKDLYLTPGRRQEIKNLKQVLEIVAKPVKIKEKDE